MRVVRTVISICQKKIPLANSSLMCGFLKQHDPTNRQTPNHFLPKLQTPKTAKTTSMSWAKVSEIIVTMFAKQRQTANQQRHTLVDM